MSAFRPLTFAVAALMAMAVMVVIGGALTAQSVMGQLGLTETEARNFVLDEIKNPAKDRRSAIAIAGTRAFLRLPASARGAAVTALFAWAKAYVNSPAFNASYAKSRGDRIPQTRQYDLTVEQTVKKELDEQLADVERMKQVVATMSPADRAAVLESIKEAEKNLRDPEFIKQLHAQLAAQRAQESGNDASLAAKVEETMPADPKKLFARRLREFLDATADVDFSTRTISLTGGADGIEFIDPAVRTKPWRWHEAVIVGPEATAAARAAAQAWLKEIER